MSILSPLISIISHAAGARSCIICSAPLAPGEEALCMDCLLQLPRTRMLHLQRNALSDIAGNGPAPPEICTAWISYSPFVPSSAIVRNPKYYRWRRHSQALGRLFGEELLIDTADLPLTFGQIDVLLPVPMHWFKEMKRGFNQSEMIARGLAQAGGMAVGDNLTATRSHRTQTRRRSDSRASNIAGSMLLEHPSELDGLHIAIVDDLVTTGATITEAVAAIGASGARPAGISVLALGTRLQ